MTTPHRSAVLASTPSVSLDVAAPPPVGVTSGDGGPAAENLAERLSLSAQVKRVAIAQITTDPGALEKNLHKVLRCIDQAREGGADLVVFPELTLPGYAHMDLAWNREMVRDNERVLQEIAAHSAGITVIVGYIRSENGRMNGAAKPLLHNSAAVIHNGEIVHAQDKTLLPDFGPFSERRYFEPGAAPSTFKIGATRIGLAICEDLWSEEYERNIARELGGQGADLIVSLNASPFHAGKLPERLKMLRKATADSGATVIYANLVGGFDGYDGELVFDGRSMAISRDGELLGLGKAFAEDIVFVDVHQPIPIPVPSVESIHEIHDALVLGIREYFRRNGFKHAYIGLSGGIDSAVTAALCVEALGAENVIGVTMPSHVTSSETKGDAYRLAENLGIRCIERSIRREYDAWLEEFRAAHDGAEPQRLTKQNKQARIRGAILMDCTNEDRAGLVVSTGNKTEVALGYCTLYGDMCGGFAAIADVSKLRVYELADFINRRNRRAVIPPTTIARAPSAELEEGQTDAANLPADYDMLSPLVDEIVEHGTPRAELITRYPEAVVDRTIRLIELNEYKRRQASPGIRVTSRAFGMERRMPMGQGYRSGWLPDGRAA